MTGGDRLSDLLIIGAGPTGIAIGARALRAGLEILVVDRGPVAANLVDFPSDMRFFTTRDRLEIADIPFALPHDKPSRREALAYYRAVAAHYRLPLAQYEEVLEIEPSEAGFEVVTSSREGRKSRRARSVALASGYSHRPRRLGVEGEEQAWVHHRYVEPYRYFRHHVAVIGGGNSAAEAALDLWRNHVEVTVVHRRGALKDTVKYWLKPDLENRVAEGSIAAHFESDVRRFGSNTVEIEGADGAKTTLDVDAAYVLVGYEPDFELLRRAGVRVDERTLEPAVDSETCESNVPGLYVAGTLQAGRDLGRIFIENSRRHADLIVEHLLETRGAMRQGTAPTA